MSRFPLVLGLSAIAILNFAVAPLSAQSVTSSKYPADWALIYSKALDKNRDALSRYTSQTKSRSLKKPNISSSKPSKRDSSK